MEVKKSIPVTLILILLSVHSLQGTDTDDLNDFEFDTSTDIDVNTETDSEYYYMDEMSSPAPFSLNVERIDNDFDLLDDEFPSDNNQQSDFIIKEKHLRDILLRAMTSYEMKRKFAQVLPILRVMSSSQRVALAALISAQVSAKPGKELNLAQVRQMFGDRQDLILPLVLDIANLVRLASKQETNIDAVSEQEPIQSNQLLRRSFQTRTKKSTQENNYPVKTSIETVPVANLNDDSLSVEDDDSELITTDLNSKSPEHLDQIQSLPLVRVDPFNPFQKLSDHGDKRSFHERILNMTLYRGLTDQLAMPSDGVPLQITLPRAPPQLPVQQETGNLTLEQIEDLAFSNLNGTDNQLINGTNGENLPEPEMLIGGRYRVKGISYSTVRHKDLKTNTAGSCQRFTGTICLHSDDYPMEQIMGSIRRNKYAISALLAEYKDKANDDDDYEDNSQRYNKRRREDSSEQTPSSGGMCQSLIRYARPQKARSASGEWKFIVNTGQHTQTLRLEKCNNPQDSCTYLTDNFKSRCVQIFNYHRLLSWDKSRGLHVDIFKVPTCCSCHIDGYREAFPPLASPSNSFISSTNANGNVKYQQFDINEYRPHNTVQRVKQYTTINEHDLEDETEEDEDDDDESVSYQFSNGFKLNPYKYDTSGLLQSSSNQKNKFDRSKPSKINYSLNPTLGTYLSPPSNEYDTYNFLNHNAEIITGSSKRGRRPVRRDQSISASEMKANKVPLSQVILTTKRPRKRLQSTIDDKLKYVTSPGHDEFQAKRIVAKLPKASTTMQTVTVSNSGYPTTVDFKRVNYNYHPIIDFFEEDNDKEDRKGVPREKQNSWRPMIVPQARRHLI